MKDRILNALLNEVKPDMYGKYSRRDRAALELIRNNTKIEYINRWYIVTLFNETRGIYCNTKNLFPAAYKLTYNNTYLWNRARDIAKSEYKTEV